MSEQPTECRSEEGITEGLIDSLIFILRVLVTRDLTTNEAQAALTDLAEDPDLRTVLNARQID